MKKGHVLGSFTNVPSREIQFKSVKFEDLTNTELMYVISNS